MLDHHPDQVDLEEAIASECKPFCGLRRDYGVVVCDPPWAFAVRSKKGMGRSAENHYSTMTLDDIRALPVAKIAGDSCALMLWVTNPFLDVGMDVLKGWGFRYSTKVFEWAKLNRKVKMGDPLAENSFFMGMGFTTRQNTESCLLGVRGAPKRLDAGVRQLIVSNVREHSRKPDEVYERAERLYAGPYLDMFSRQQRPGWDSWGHERTKFDE